MANDARRKERHRLKREAKRRQLHKQQSISPFKRIEIASEVVACYVNTDWRERGQATVFVLREMRDGSLAFVCFLVDTWCAGLKDIWCKFDVYSDEFDGVLRNMSGQMGNSIVRVPLEEARHLLAGGIRFARQNGFRLPDDWRRCSVFIDRELNTADASLDGFGFEGNPESLHWCAPLHDLRGRLIGCTAEEFLARPDVKYTMDLDDEVIGRDELALEDSSGVTLDPDDAAKLTDALAGAAKEMAMKGALVTADWLRARGQEPSPRLSDAILLVLVRDTVPEKDEPLSTPPAETQMMQMVSLLAASELLKSLKGQPFPDDLKTAIRQVDEFVDSYPSYADAQAAWLGTTNEEIASAFANGA